MILNVLDCYVYSNFDLKTPQIHKKSSRSVILRKLDMRFINSPLKYDGWKMILLPFVSSAYISGFLLLNFQGVSTNEQCRKTLGVQGII